jgi:steroid Delta-isomerase
MPDNTDAQIRHVYEQWHAALNAHDLYGMVALYAEDAVLETPAVLAMYPDREDGVLRGRGDIAELFARNFRALSTAFQALYRTGLFFSDGKLLTWEYPRQTPNGEQVDLFESMDIEHGLIVYHRVYWGWKGLKTLIAARDAQSP